MVATAIEFWPAAPLFLLMHGKDITISQGHRDHGLRQRLGGAQPGQVHRGGQAIARGG